MLPEMICWHEGMPLLPQHFQLHSLRAEVLPAYLCASTQPYYWGLKKLTLDQSALPVGKIRVTALEAIMPDGMPICFQASSEMTLEFDCNTLPSERQSGLLTLYLAVAPLYRAKEPQMLSERYQSIGSDPIPDLASGKFPNTVPLWLPKLHLVDEESRADFICMPIMKLMRYESGYAQMPYSPPCPVVSADCAIAQQVNALCRLAREKSLFLTQRLQAAINNRDEQEITQLFRQLDRINSRLPEVEGVLSCEVAHPLTLYRVLCGMLGETACLHGATDLPVLPPFNYLEIQKSFEPLIQALQRNLDGVRSASRRHVFSAMENGFYIDMSALPASSRKIAVGLRMPSSSHAPEAEKWMSRAIIASKSHLQTLIRQRMRGMAREIVPPLRKPDYDSSAHVFIYWIEAESEWFSPLEPLCLYYLQQDGARPLDATLYLKDVDA